MDYDRFIATVERAGAGDRESAEWATRATLATLAERLGADEARHLVAELPAQLGGWAFAAGGAKAYDVEEFLRRVADREGVDPATAERHSGAVLTALAQAVSDKEFEHIVARLPKNFAPLLPRGLDVVPEEEFLDRVARRAGVDAGRARLAVEAVLETLAERIAPGEVDDLIERLPIALHAPLRRGKSRNPGNARRMPVEEFLRRVATREGVPPEQAREHTRAVLAELRDAIGNEEFTDIAVQFPGEYGDLLPST
jgi:uncharacterized protein (DUF2267 family)